MTLWRKYAQKRGKFSYEYSIQWVVWFRDKFEQKFIQPIWTKRFLGQVEPSTSISISSKNLAGVIHVVNKIGTGGPQIHSTNFAPPRNCTIAIIVLSGDQFSTKIVIYDFWISKVLFFAHFHKIWLFLVFIAHNNN